MSPFIAVFTEREDGDADFVAAFATDHYIFPILYSQANNAANIAEDLVATLNEDGCVAFTREFDRLSDIPDVLSP